MIVPTRRSNRRPSAAVAPKRRCITTLAAAASMAIGLAIVLGCGHSPTRVPTSPPDITGQVTAVDPAGEGIGTIRVEAAPQDSSGSAKAVVRVGPATTVIGPGSKVGTFETLQVGQSVRIWFTGSVRESYPLQAAAATVVVDVAAP
jgi:uncharacterized protein DUF3221